MQKRVNSKHRKIHHMAKSLWTLYSLVYLSAFSGVRLWADFHLLEQETWSTYITYCCSFRDKHKGEGFARMSVYSYPTSFWSIPDYNTIYWSEKIIFLPVFVFCWNCAMWNWVAMASGCQKTPLIRKGTEWPVNSSSISLSVCLCVCVCVCVVQIELSSDLSSQSTCSRWKVSKCFP